MAGELLPVFIKIAFLPLCGVCFSFLVGFGSSQILSGGSRFCLVARNGKAGAELPAGFLLTLPAEQKGRAVQWEGCSSVLSSPTPVQEQYFLSVPLEFKDKLMF